MKTIILATFLVMSGAMASDLIVHEWGTFTSLVGSDGVRQTGMFHEDEILPDFVHNFGEHKMAPSLFAVFPPNPTNPPVPTPRPHCGRVTKVGCEFLVGQDITQKMETPVLYFHAKTPQKVSVEVAFPGGIISQTFPAPVLSLPFPTPGVKLENGFARFNVEVVTDKLNVPFVDAKNIYSHARNVDANFVKSEVNNENEKFIFYRGLGKFETQLKLTSHNGTLKVENGKSNSIPSVYLFDINDNGGSFIKLGQFKAHSVKTVSDKDIRALQSNHDDTASFTAKAETELLSSLIANGLNTDEAVAMLKTWEQGYFKTKGLRILYILNRTEVESILPMKISPVPQSLNRVFVGRIEVLLDTEENALLSQISKEGMKFDILSLGRFAPSILARLKQIAVERGMMNAQLIKAFNSFEETIAQKL
jgi:hypothetical protein